MAEKLGDIDAKQAMTFIEDVWRSALPGSDVWVRADRARTVFAEKLFARDPEAAHQIVRHVWQVSQEQEASRPEEPRVNVMPLTAPSFGQSTRAVTPDTFFARLRSNIWFSKDNTTEQ